MLALPTLLLLLAVGVKEVTVFHLTAAHVDHLLDTGDLLEYKLPGVPKVVALVCSKFQYLMDHLYVLLFDLLLVCH